MNTHAQPSRPRFHPGFVLASPGATAACSHQYLSECLARHLRGDWGGVSADERARNEAALRSGTRVLSSYPTRPAEPGDLTRLCIVTEPDRRVTTLLLAGEY